MSHQKDKVRLTFFNININLTYAFTMKGMDPYVKNGQTFIYHRTTKMLHLFTVIFAANIG